MIYRISAPETMGPRFVGGGGGGSPSFVVNTNGVLRSKLTSHNLAVPHIFRRDKSRGTCYSGAGLGLRRAPTVSSASNLGSPAFFVLYGQRPRSLLARPVFLLHVEIRLKDNVHS